jgi:hypothetical protein
MRRSRIHPRSRLYKLCTIFPIHELFLGQYREINVIALLGMNNAGHFPEFPE